MGLLEKLIGEDATKEWKGKDRSFKKQVDKEPKPLKWAEGKKNFSKPDKKREILGIVEGVEKVGKMGLTTYWNIAITKSEILFYYSSSGVKEVLRGYGALMFGAVGVLAEAGIKKILRKEKTITIDDLISKAKEHILLPISYFKKLKFEPKLFGKIIKFEYEGKEVIFKLSRKQYKQVLVLCGIKEQK